MESKEEISLASVLNEDCESADNANFATIDNLNLEGANMLISAEKSDIDDNIETMQAAEVTGGRNLNEDSEEEITNARSRLTKKRNANFSDDSDEGDKKEEQIDITSEIPSDHQDDENATSKVGKSKKRYQKFSDSEDETASDLKKDTSNPEMPDKLVFSTDDEEQSRETSVVPKNVKAKKRSPKSSSETDSSKDDEDSDENDIMSPKLRTKKLKKKMSISKSKDTDEGMTNKMKDLCDADSSSDSEDSEQSQHSNDDSISSKPNQEKASRPPQRMSAKEAEEQMKLIQSESQRLAREAKFSVPYHRPKSHSLKEFLNRRTINKAVPINDNRKAAAAIKMTKEELEIYAKSLEERAKESLEFFKSESEEEPADTEETLANNTEGNDELKNEINEQTSTDKLADEMLIGQNDEAMEVSNEEIKTVNEENSIGIISENIVSKEKEKITNEIGEEEVEHEENKIDSKIDDTVENKIKNGENVENKIKNNDSIESIIPPIESSVAKTAIVNDETEQNSEQIEEILNKQATASDILIDYNFGSVDRTTATDEKSNRKLKMLLESQFIDLPPIPTLKGSSNTVIDFETGEIKQAAKSGADELFERFLKHSTKKAKRDTVDLSVIVQKNGQVEVEKITTHLDEADETKVRPTFIQIKEALGKQIVEKRKEEILKKINLLKETNECSEEEDDEEIDEFDEEYSDCEQNDKVKEVNDEGKETLVEDEEKAEENFMEDEADEDDDEENVSDEKEEEDDEINNTENIDGTVNKSRKRIILQEDSDDDDLKQESDMFATTQMIDSQPISLHQAQPTPNLYDTSFNENSLPNTEIVTETQKPADNTETQSNLPSQLFTQENGGVSESQLLELCSGTFTTQQATVVEPTQVEDSTEISPQKTQINAKLAFESSEDEDEIIANKEIKLKKKVEKLQFSDDEYDDEEAPKTVEENDEDEEDVPDDNESLISSDEEKTEDVDVNRVVDYDSEENEIEVRQEKREKKKKMAEFFENEAELSESEWGSADEDERDMDKFDIELGDEEQFDKAKLQSELERIHLRQVLDQDAREVKIIKEMLFEDEEDTGLGRERQFKWKNIDANLNIDDQDKNDDGNEIALSDEENEEEFRKMRHERETMKIEAAANQNLENSNLNSPSFSITTDISVRKKINIIKTANNTPQLVAKSSPFLISNSVKTIKTTVSRGSFLNSDEKTLSRLAILTKNTNEDGVISTVSAGKGKNFVFTALSPAVADKFMTKRKAEDDKTAAAADENQRNIKKFKRSNAKSIDTTKKVNKRLLDIL